MPEQNHTQQERWQPSREQMRSSLERAFPVSDDGSFSSLLRAIDEAQPRRR